MKTLKTNIYGRIYDALHFNDMGEAQEFIKTDPNQEWYCLYTCPIQHDMFFVKQTDKGQLTKEAAIEFAVKNELFFGKFVKTSEGYFIGHSNEQHNTIFPKEQIPISAGFIGILQGKELSLRREWSSSLKLSPDENDLKGLEEFFGLPGTKEE